METNLDRLCHGARQTCARPAAVYAVTLAEL